MEKNISFLPTQRNGELLISDDGFCYLRQKSSEDAKTEYWTCDKRRKCPGRGISKNNRQQFYATRQHNHLPDKLGLEMRSIKTNMKGMSENAIGANTTSNIVHCSLMIASDAAKARLPSLDNLKRNIQRCRNRAQVPLPLPQSRDDISIPEEFKFTGNQLEPFLLWDSGPAVNGVERIMIFGTQRNLDYLETCNAILMDGTFKTTPHLFHQLYTIHGTRPEGADQKPGKAVPVLFLLLPNKTGSTYARAFSHISAILPGWQPERVMMDFERAAVNAAQAQWPSSQITCCFFHLNQNIWKKIRELGLSMFYGENVENATRLKMISALAFVPPDDVIASWEALLEILQPWQQQQPFDIQEKLDDLFTYFEINYIGKNIAGVRREPRIAAIHLWNVRNRTLECYGRTDNEVEGFHMKIGYTVGAQFPNLWKFLRGLQGLQVETEKYIEEINAGVVGRKQRPVYIRLSERISNVTSTWSNRPNLEVFLRGISHNFYYGGH